MAPRLSTSLINLAYQQQAIVAQLVAAEIQAASVKDLTNILRYKPLS